MAPVDGKDPDPDELAQRFNARFGTKLTGDDLSDEIEMLELEDAGQADSQESPTRVALRRRSRRALRQELNDLEQFVLFQIFDQSWKDHLYAMDMLKTGIGLVGFAEEDPRIKYKKRRIQLFPADDASGVRDKVTDLVFRARVGKALPGRKPGKRLSRETGRHAATPA